jgi:hypothetical protein
METQFYVTPDYGGTIKSPHDYGDGRFFTSFPAYEDTNGLRNLWYLIEINAADYMGRSYRLGAPKQNNSLVVTEEIMDSLND